eukprot:gene12250-12337_t
MISRAERSIVGNWWWTIDRWLLAALGVLMIMGVMLAMAGSPAVAERLGLPTFHFVNRQFMYLGVSLPILIGCSFLPPRYVRRVALGLFAISYALILVTILHRTEIKGASRWILGVQPSEFVKPAFAILAAWAFSEGARRTGLPGTWIGVLLMPLTIIPLVLQPDFGQTMLISIVWAALFFMAGLHWFWVGGLLGGGMSAVLLAYRFVPHVRARILKFLEPGQGNGGDSFQVDTAIDSFINGSWFGKGPGEGTVKRILPDSHTDFIFAVTGEEFGIVGAIVVVSVFAFIVLRGLILAARNEDPFARFAAAGLLILFGIQACINMSVNLHLMPAKGMTLPFISYGGSSMISLAITMGFLVAVTRKRPRSEIMADALSVALQKRGAIVHLATDERALQYSAEFPAAAVHAVPSATPTGGSVFGKLKAAIMIGRGVLAARSLLKKIQPACVVGFGGYPTVPPMLAAQQLKIPTLLHEQNAVVGRANRFLAQRATLIGTGFPDVGGLSAEMRAKARFVGNPLRPNVMAAAELPMPAFDGTLHLLITGGSQGARVFSDIVPAAVALLEPEFRAKLNITQQARGEDEARVRAVYAALNMQANVAPFFADLPQRIAQSHLVIGRSGASTVSELAAIGRASILVPLPGAIDQDQAANAAILAKIGAAQLVRQPEFTAEWLANELKNLILNPSDLTARAAAAKSAGILNAADRLAELVLGLIPKS